MKKIGILTFSRANNYGALLQAYALKECINLLGAKAEIINYLCPKIENDYAFFSGKVSAKWFIKKLGKILFLPKIILYNNRFNQFRKKYLADTEEISQKNIGNINDIYDIFISGSDQVFNPRITNFDSNYLLSFVRDNAKKYSYAASLGISEVNEKEKNFLIDNLKTFSAISIREKQGSQIVEELINKQVLTHLDPTLLLNKNAWQKVAKHNKKKEKFILLYLMNRNDRILSFTKKLAEKTGLKVIYISDSLINRTSFSSICVTPQEWLGYFWDAEYVVTNSFHGLAFSINFNKNFFVDLLPPTWPVNSRLENILDLTQLRNRLIDNIGTNYEAEIDWEKVNKIIDNERKNAKDYLRGICEQN